MFASAALVGVLGGEETPSEQGPASAEAHWPEGSVVEMLGVNEAISYPERLEEQYPIEYFFVSHFPHFLLSRDVR